ncbi:hypothetical protein [Lewinella sp. JB7]|uniref:hypothetical protein n=1 Tax=Lewinella sp. JB7 TaxID=2962887 RepID=UPI0020CA0267|nr:hypothetical protein [Lewinella sp. JB7]MCP9235862.1 hypothetical protein [Lewinella sp. JB7]
MDQLNKNIFEGFGQLLKGKLNLSWKLVLYFISIVVSVGIYVTIINTIDPNSNVVLSVKRLFRTPNYNFFSGGEKGVYFTIVSTLKSGIEREGATFNITNRITSGGSENAIKVLTTPNSFGLVQEETVNKDDFVRQQLNYITPLYVERMHIVLRVDERVRRSGNFTYINPPVLSSNTADDVLDLFANARISTGPVGSGSIVIASYILAELNNQIREKGIIENQQVLNLSMKDGLSNIREEYNEPDKIDILFTIAGAPIRDLKTMLTDEQYMLVSIDPSFVSTLNAKNGINLRLTDFKYSQDGISRGIYHNSSGVSALGSYAWLISSKGVPSRDILTVLKHLEKNTVNVAENLGVENPTIEHSPLKEMNFYELYKIKHDRVNISEWKAILIFASTFIVSLVIVFSFLLYILSYRKQSKYFHDIVKVINASFPANTELENNNYPVGLKPEHIDLPFRRPRVMDDQNGIIDKIIVGLQQILLLTDEINEDFQSGALTNTSFTFLMTKIEDTRSKLQQHLGRRLNEVIERDNGFKGRAILDDLRIYYTAGYLQDEDYRMLTRYIKEEATSGMS